MIIELIFILDLFKIFILVEFFNAEIVDFVVALVASVKESFYFFHGVSIETFKFLAWVLHCNYSWLVVKFALTDFLFLLDRLIDVESY